MFSLLNRAIADIRYALEIPISLGDESDLNLYNSLANVYFDLLRVEAAEGASKERLDELRALGSEATQRAYLDSSPFVIETYVKDLLHRAEAGFERRTEFIVEALGVLFGPGERESSVRVPVLGTLADRALSLLFAAEVDTRPSAVAGPVGALCEAWRALARARDDCGSFSLDLVTPSMATEALAALERPEVGGNMLVLRLRFDLLAVARPFAFGEQVEVMEQLQATLNRLPAQSRLEDAILLYQVERAQEGDRVFRELRKLWKETKRSYMSQSDCDGYGPATRVSCRWFTP